MKKLTAILLFGMMCVTSVAKAMCVYDEDRGPLESNPDSCERNGELHGKWVLFYADGAVHQGHLADSKRTGHWVEHTADGAVNEGPYSNDEREGHWILRVPAGAVEEGQYRNSKRDGRWTVRLSDGRLLAAEFVAGEGEWEDTGRTAPAPTDELYDNWVFCKHIDGSVSIQGQSVTYLSTFFRGTEDEYDIYKRGFTAYLEDTFDIYPFEHNTECLFERNKKKLQDALRKELRAAKSRNRQGVIRNPWNPDL